MGDKTGVDLIREERERQVAVEGWTPAHDDEHVQGEMAQGEMAMAAACYAAPQRIGVMVERRCDLSGIREIWEDPFPWSEDWDKRREHSRLRQLVIAGALIAAEIDRLSRKKAGEKGA